MTGRAIIFAAVLLAAIAGQCHASDSISQPTWLIEPGSGELLGPLAPSPVGDPDALAKTPGQTPSTHPPDATAGWQYSIVPEPATGAFLVIGATILFASIRRRRHDVKPA